MVPDLWGRQGLSDMRGMDEACRAAPIPRAGVAGTRPGETQRWPDGKGCDEPRRASGNMTATTYYAMTADDQLAEAQRTLDTHITSSATGRCLACGTLGPCWRRETAVSIFSRTLRLPRRHPGATRPELVGARRVGMGALG